MTRSHGRLCPVVLTGETLRLGNRTAGVGPLNLPVSAPGGNPNSSQRAVRALELRGDAVGSVPDL